MRGRLLEQGLEGTRFLVAHGGKETEAWVGVPGAHHVYNALAAIASAWLVTGWELARLARGLEGFSPAWGRCAWEEVRGVAIINDAYNSNPDSLTAALRTLASSKANRRVAVIGDMLELGEYAEEAHAGIGELVADLGIDLLCTYGEMAALTCQEATKAGIEALSFNSHQEIAEHLSSWLQPGDLVLVKGSRGMRMENVIEHLKGENP